MTGSSSANHIDLLTPDAFVSPAKSAGVETAPPPPLPPPPPPPIEAPPASGVATPSPPPPPPQSGEMLALSSPRRPASVDVTSSTMAKDDAVSNGVVGAASGDSSPSREVRLASDF